MADLNALTIFAQVVQANSFSEAARRLNMPVSTVSRRITELEAQLGLRLLERSTRSLRLTEVGADIFVHAQRSADLSHAVDNIASDQRTDVSGLLRLSAPPNISDTLITPLVSAFQASHPNVRVQIFITERHVDHIAEGIDLAFRIGALKDSALVAQKILTYRHQLLASPAYLEKVRAPETPQDLLQHRLLAFAYWKAEKSWTFVNTDSKQQETLTFQPSLSMNDFVGLATALVTGDGIGDLPPVVQPSLVRDGRLVEIMPKWHFRAFDLALIHLGNRNIPRPVRAFKEFAARMAPVLFPSLPT